MLAVLKISLTRYRCCRLLHLLCILHCILRYVVIVCSLCQFIFEIYRIFIMTSHLRHWARWYRHMQTLKLIVETNDAMQRLNLGIRRSRYNTNHIFWPDDFLVVCTEVWTWKICIANLHVCPGIYLRLHLRARASLMWQRHSGEMT